MSDFENSGMTFDEPTKRRTPGTWFADLGDRLARGFNGYDRPPDHDAPWETYEDTEQPTAAADAIDWDPTHPTHPPARKRFPTAMHGYDRDAVDAHLAVLERELDELREQRLPAPAVEAEIERVGAETSAILRVAHEQAAEITRRAQGEADRCVADAAANAVAMTEEAKRNLRQLDSETDAVWAERGRLIEDVRNVATALFSLAEDATDRFPEEEKRAAAERAPAPAHPPRAVAREAPPAASPARAAAPDAPAPASPARAAAPDAPAPAPKATAGEAVGQAPAAAKHAPPPRSLAPHTAGGRAASENLPD
jgi:DivIVA domain-containing protein